MSKAKTGESRRCNQCTMLPLMQAITSTKMLSADVSMTCSRSSSYFSISKRSRTQTDSEAGSDAICQNKRYIVREKSHGSANRRKPTSTHRQSDLCQVARRVHQHRIPPFRFSSRRAGVTRECVSNVGVFVRTDYDWREVFDHSLSIQPYTETNVILDCEILALIAHRIHTKSLPLRETSRLRLHIGHLPVDTRAESLHRGGSQ